MPPNPSRCDIDAGVRRGASRIQSNESGDIDHNQDKFWGKLRFDQRLTWNKRPPGDFTGDYKIDKQIQFSAVWFGWEERDSCTSGSIGKTETVVRVIYNLSTMA